MLQAKRFSCSFSILNRHSSYTIAHVGQIMTCLTLRTDHMGWGI